MTKRQDNVGKDSNKMRIKTEMKVLEKRREKQ